MNNFEKILVAVIILIILVAGFVLYFQQKSINRMENYIQQQQGALGVNQTANGPNTVKQQTVVEQEDQGRAAASIKENLIKNTLDIIGEITQISQGTIIVKAEIVDLSAIKDDYFSNPPKKMVTDKTYKIDFDNNTLFDPMKFSDLKIGDKIQAFSDKPILKVDEFLAKEITTNFRLEGEAQ